MTRVLLVGAPGSGKSAVGAALAARTGWPFLDADALLERAVGRSPRALLAAEGEPALRAAESRALTLLLALPEPLVGAVAAGVALDEADRERLRGGGHVVWLRAGASTLARRPAGASGRSWLGADPAGALARLVGGREPLLGQVAHQVVQVDVLTAAQAARAILDALERRPEP